MTSADYTSTKHTMNEETFWNKVDSICERYNTTAESDEAYDALMNTTIYDPETRLHQDVMNEEALEYFERGLASILEEKLS